MHTTDEHVCSSVCLHYSSNVWGRLSNVFKEVSCVHQDYIYLAKNTVKHWSCEILLQFQIMVFYFNVYFQYNLLLWCNAEFPAVINSSLQSSVSHDPSEIILICWFAAQETFLIIFNVETVVLLNTFFRILWWKLKYEQHLFEMESFVVLVSLLSLLIGLMHPCWIIVLLWEETFYWPQTLNRRTAYII